MTTWMVTGCGTEVGKTVISAILATVFKAAYWKPIECGPEKDSQIMCTLLDPAKHTLYPPAYSLQAPLSPHHAAQVEGIEIDPTGISIPKTSGPLVIEGVGGLLVPLTKSVTTLDLFRSWPCRWIVVSRAYLGSINHTLMTLELLKLYQLPIAGIIFNGESNKESEEAILTLSQIPLLARVCNEPKIDFQTIQRYAKEWRKIF